MTVAWQIEYEKSLARKEARAAGLAEGREVGLAEGRAEGRVSLCVDLVRKGLLSVTQAAEQLGISEDEVRKMME